MPARISTFHPPIERNPLTFISGGYTSGTTLNVQNTADFLANDYLLIEVYGTPTAEICQVGTITGASSITLTGTLQFGHPPDAFVTKIDYNQYQVYISTTGIGGTYTQITPNRSISVAQQFSTFTDPTALSTYSYKTRWINTTTGAQSLFTTELPASGFPFYSLGSLQQRVLDLYVDSQGSFITIDSINNWSNELLARANREVTESESTLFVDFTTFTPGTSEYTDITSYGVESIALIEYSSDGGLTYRPDTINPTDPRIKSSNTSSYYSYKIINQKLFVYAYGNSNVPAFPSNYMVRMWYFTQQPQLTLQSDLLPIVYRSFSDVWVDYCMTRANEQSRRLSESATYFDKRFLDGFKSMTESIKSRINQGNKTMATSWIDSFNNY